MITVSESKKKTLGACKSEILKLQRKDFSNKFVRITKDSRRWKETSKDGRTALLQTIKDTEDAMANEGVHEIVENFV